jgi:hypothetical protein
MDAVRDGRLLEVVLDQAPVLSHRHEERDLTGVID